MKENKSSMKMEKMDYPRSFGVVLCQDLAQNKMRSSTTKLLAEKIPSHTFF